jgi:hypothetical protein
MRRLALTTGGNWGEQVVARIDAGSAWSYCHLILGKFSVNNRIRARLFGKY